MGRALQIASGRNNEAVKPEPPADLLQQMDAARELLGPMHIEKPDNTFTTEEWRKRYDINNASARRQIEKLEALGKIKHIGTGKKGVKFYRFV